MTSFITVTRRSSDIQMFYFSSAVQQYNSYQSRAAREAHVWTHGGYKRERIWHYKMSTVCHDDPSCICPGTPRDHVSSCRMSYCCLPGHWCMLLVARRRVQRGQYTACIYQWAEFPSFSKCYYYCKRLMWTHIFDQQNRILLRHRAIKSLFSPNIFHSNIFL